MNARLRIFCLLVAFWCAIVPLGFSASAQAQTYAPEKFSDQRRWNKVGDLLRAVEAAFSASVPRRAAVDAVEAVEPEKMLEWSGEAGVLFFVRMQVPETGSRSASPLGTPVLIGVGAHPLNAAMLGFYSPPRLPQSDAGMREAGEHSFFVWASLEQGRLRFRRLMPAETLLLQDAADRANGDPVTGPKLRRAHAARVIDGVRARFARQSGVATQLVQVDSALADYTRARVALGNGEQNRIDWRYWEKRTGGALDLITRYRYVLTLSELRTQAYVLTRSGLRDAIRRVPDAVALASVLKDERDKLRQNLGTLDVPTLCRTEVRAYQAFFNTLALQGEQRNFMLRLLPIRTETPCLPGETETSTESA